MTNKKKSELEILAVILLSGKVYAIIKPATAFPIRENTGKVFELIKNNDEELLTAVYDKKVYDAVFRKYRKIKKEL